MVIFLKIQIQCTELADLYGGVGIQYTELYFFEMFVQFNPINGLTQNKISQEILDLDCKKKQIYTQTCWIQFCNDLNRSILDSFGIALGLRCKSQLKKTYW